MSSGFRFGLTRRGWRSKLEDQVHRSEGGAVSRPEVLVTEAGTGEQLGSGRLLLATADIYLSEYTIEPGGEPGDPHYHAEHSDSFYVLEGELDFAIGDRTVRATRGTALSAPRGAIHAFPVAVGGPARFLNLHTPGGFERYMRQLVAMRERGEAPDREFMAAHDMYLV